MINHIKYLPFKLRSSDEACKPIGPTSLQAKSTTFLFGGSTLRLQVPKHSPSSRHHKQFNLSERDLSGITYDRISRCSSSRWEQCEFLSRQWAFWGPWFSGKQADLSIYGVAYRLKKAPDNEQSNFNPKYFENSLAEILNDNYGTRTNSDGEALFIAPLNWKASTLQGISTAYFSIEPIDGLIAAPSRQCIAFSIARDTVVIVFLGQTIHRKGNKQKRLDQVDASNLVALQNFIIDNIEVTLAPEAQANLDQIKSENPDIQLTKTFAPLKWPVLTNEKKDGPSPDIQALGN